MHSPRHVTRCIENARLGAAVKTALFLGGSLASGTADAGANICNSPFTHALRCSIVPSIAHDERGIISMSMVPKIYYWLRTLMVLTILAVRGPLILHVPKMFTV